MKNGYLEIHYKVLIILQIIEFLVSISHFTYNSRKFLFYLLQEISFLSTQSECQYRSVNLNNTKLQPGHTAPSFFVVDGAYC